MTHKKSLFLFILLIAGIFLAKTFIEKKSTNIISESELKSNGLSDNEYTEALNEFLQILDKNDPKIALETVREKIKTNDALLQSCHALVHEIGHESYEKYGSFGIAMSYQDEICNSGYLHGIIESYFSESTDVFVSMKKVCGEYPAGKFISWECYHGIGHGLMYYTSNDLNKSIELCKEYENDFAKTSCTNGVFMENFNVDQKLHISNFLKKEDPFSPCSEQDSKNKSICYLYAPTYYLALNNNDYKKALRWCVGAELSHIDDCSSGVGSQTMKNNINHPEIAENVCMSGYFFQKKSCVTGMIDIYINHHGSIEPAKILCEKLMEKNRETCYQTVSKMEGMF